jgi:hypothetical protein
MKANLKKTIMAAAVLGSMTMPYLAKDAEAICLISCSRRATAATATNQTESNTVWGSYRGHELTSYSSQYQTGDIKVGNTAFGNTVVGPTIAFGGDNNAAISANQSNNFGFVGNTFGHSAVNAPQAAGDVRTAIVPSNTALSRATTPLNQNDMDNVDVKVK